MESKENKSKLFCEKSNKQILKSQKPNPVDVYVGSRLKFKRIEKRLSQSAIGSLLGLTFQQVQKYERGLNRIGSSRLYQLSKILNVPISYFFENYEAEDNFVKMINGGCADGADNDVGLEKDVKALIKYFCMIKSRNLRKSVVGLARGLNVKDLGDGKII